MDAHGKEPVNFQISMLIYNAIAAVFCLMLVGFVFLLLWVLNTLSSSSPPSRRAMANSTATR